MGGSGGGVKVRIRKVRESQEKDTSREKQISMNVRTRRETHNCQGNRLVQEKRLNSIWWAKKCESIRRGNVSTGQRRLRQKITLAVLANQIDITPKEACVG